MVPSYNATIPPRYATPNFTILHSPACLTCRAIKASPRTTYPPPPSRSRRSRSRALRNAISTSPKASFGRCCCSNALYSCNSHINHVLRARSTAHIWRAGSGAARACPFVGMKLGLGRGGGTGLAYGWGRTWGERGKSLAGWESQGCCRVMQHHASGVVKRANTRLRLSFMDSWILCNRFRRRRGMQVVRMRCRIGGGERDDAMCILKCRRGFGGAMHPWMSIRAEWRGRCCCYR